MVKGVLSKGQRERKKNRQLTHGVIVKSREDWNLFMAAGHDRNKYLEAKKDREMAEKLLRQMDIGQGLKVDFG
jgi:hypothetical protein